MDAQQGTQGPPPGADLSSSAVTALVIVTLIVSFFGAWVSIHQAMSLPRAQEPRTQADGGTAGLIGFDIDRPSSAHDDAGGLVAFRIEPRTQHEAVR